MTEEEVETKIVGFEETLKKVINSATIAKKALYMSRGQRPNLVEIALFAASEEVSGVFDDFGGFISASEKLAQEMPEDYDD